VKKVYLFDGTGLAYRAFYGIKKELSTSEGFPTKAIFGFIRIFLKLYKKFKPQYAAVAFDVSRKTFRKEILSSYKENRKATAESFKVQVPVIKEFLKCFGVKVLEAPGYEADDILATLAKELADKSYEVFIITSDKDMRQVISERVKVISISPKTGKEELYDLKRFLEEYGIEPSKLPEVFGLSGDSTDNIPGVPGIGEKTAIKLIKEFESLEGVYENLRKLTPKRRELLEKHKEKAFLSRKLAKVNFQVPLKVKPEDLKVREPDGKCLGELLTKLEMRSTAQEIKKLFPGIKLSSSSLKEGKEVGFKEIRELLFPKTLFSPTEAALILTEKGAVVATQGCFSLIEENKVKELLKGTNEVFTFNAKEVYHRLGVEAKELPLFDISLAYYLIDPLLKDYSYENLIKGFLKSVEIERSERFAHYAIDFGKQIKEKLKRENLFKLYKELELPLSYVLFEMEKRGVPIDREYLKKLGEELSEKLSEIEGEIFKIAGYRFKINSPKQLSKLLFEDLGLKPLKKTKSGYSTDVETLTTLALEGHKIAELLLEYRKISKLKSTYIDGFLKHIKENGRIHTKFLQTSTATGRLSSVEPNLQNLPTGDPLSERIRKAVKAEEGFTLVWADYSQIELRVLAHLSQDEKLIEAFKEDRDIHLETAKHLFKEREVNEKMRRIAKTVNFGIIYGMSPHGLSERLGIPFQEAQEFIERYFETFPRVREFIKETLKEAYDKGYVMTIFGRKRPLPELKDKNYHVRSFGERAAVNAVIQGSAADIMKLAMVKLNEELSKLKAYMLLQVHDEIVIEAEEKIEEEVKEKVKETMEKAVELLVPLKVKTETGKRWS